MDDYIELIVVSVVGNLLGHVLGVYEERRRWRGVIARVLPLSVQERLEIEYRETYSA